MRIQRPKPIVEQVNDILRQQIRDREYPPGSRLPSESELAQALGVSRATVRTVLAKLAADGLILRKQGDGTYVNERLDELDGRYGGMWDFSRLIQNNGYQPTIQTIAIETRNASSREAELLALDEDTAVLSLTRLFFADDKPAILAANAIPVSIIEAETDTYDGQLPIHKFLREYCFQEIAYVVSEIEAALVTAKLGESLKKEPGLPILRLIETFYNKNNQPLVYGTSFYDHTVLNLHLVQAWG